MLSCILWKRWHVLEKNHLAGWGPQEGPMATEGNQLFSPLGLGGSSSATFFRILGVSNLCPKDLEALPARREAERQGEFHIHPSAAVTLPGLGVV